MNLHHKCSLIALVFDLPQEFNVTDAMPFPSDACAEWESSETIMTLSQTWESLGYNVILMPLDENFMALWSEYRNKISLVHSLVEGWGSIAREGWIGSLCELFGVPYIGSAPAAMNIAMRKSVTKMICQQNRVRTPAWYFISKMADIKAIDLAFFQKPHFIKPDAEGSGMGVDASFSISSTFEQTFNVCEKLLATYHDGILIEEYIDGPEYTSALIGVPFEPLPIAEVEVDDGVYGLSNKSKTHMGERIRFPSLPDGMRQDILDGSERLAHAIGFCDFVRFDWKATQDGTVYFLEANPLAGLSYYYSVLPKMAYQAGYTYASLLEKLAQGAWSRRNARKYWYGRSRLGRVCED